MHRKLFCAAALLSLLAGTAFADSLSNMISPISNPVNNEDPRITTEARFLYVNHVIDDGFLTGGGDVNIYALQVRAAITDRLGFIATKDGYVDFNPEAGVPQDEGWADIEAGLKYALIKDEAKGQIVSAALRYLIPVGDEEVFQGQGDGFIHPSIHGAWAIDENWNFMAGSGLRLPVDSADSLFWDFDFHIDRRVTTDYGDWYPLFEVNMVNVVDGGDRLPIADEGQDFFAFGSSAADGESILTGTAGLRYKPCMNIELGAGYQFPFSSTDGNHIIDYRWTFDFIYRFA